MDYFSEDVGAEMEIGFHTLRKVERVYGCSRGIAALRGRLELCGRQCWGMCMRMRRS